MAMCTKQDIITKIVGRLSKQGVAKHLATP